MSTPTWRELVNRLGTCHKTHNIGDRPRARPRKPSRRPSPRDLFLSTTGLSALVTVHPHEVLCIAVKTERRSIVALSVPHSLDVHRPGAVQSSPQHDGDDDSRSGDHGTQEQDAMRDERRRRQRHQSRDNEPCRNDAHPSEQNRHTAHIRFVISISSRNSSATGAPTRRIASGNSQITSSNISASSSSPRGLWKGLLALKRSARPPTRVL